SQRLDVVPAQFRVIVTHRPKYACRACEQAVVQAPAPERLIKGGLPTEAMVAYVLVAKYAWHLPLYRQAQILLAQGLDITRAVHALKLLDHYRGIVQCDGYAAYKSIANAACGEAITLAFCWAHLRRRFFDIAQGGPAPIASEALERIAALYAIEKTIRGRSA